MKEFFYTITESMLDLGLRGTELNLFAVIFGYSQKGDGCCYCDKEELARRCGVSSTRTIDAALSSLQEKGLILKVSVERNDRKRTAFSYSNSANSAPIKSANSAPQEVQILREKGANSAPINIKENKERNINTPPTPQEVEDYVRSRGYVDPQGFASLFLEICNNNGWRRHNGQGEPITNWKNYIVSSWEANNKNRVFNKNSRKVAEQLTVAEFQKFIQR